MKNILKIQKDGVNTLKEELLKNSNSKLKKTYLLLSDVKESGYDIIEEFLIDLKAKKLIALGIDKKNTTRKILENVLKYTKNVYIWDNNSEIEFNCNIIILEFEDEANVYAISGGITDALLDTDYTVYNVITYDLIKDKKEYEEYISNLTKQVKTDFTKLTKEYIDELSENKLIFTTKQYLHVLPSISELLGETKEKDETNSESKIPKVEIDKEELPSFEIDLSDVQVEPAISDSETKNEEQTSEEIYEEATEDFGLDDDVEEFENKDYDISDELIDMENMALDNEVVKIDKNKVEKSIKKQKEEISKQTSKKINLDKVSNIIMELQKKPTKGKDISKIKVQNYIKDMVPVFFEIMDDAKLLKLDDGEYKIANIKLELIDVNTGERYVDNNAFLKQKIGQTNIEFESEKLQEIMYEEQDIARIIKLAKDSYHIEVIPQGIEEYTLWKKLCTNNFRGTSRQYGLM